MVQLFRTIGDLPGRLWGRKTPVQHTDRPQTSNAPHDHFFSYTSGRWVYNEREQMRIRYVSFDVDALKRIAAKTAGADRCVQMVKIGEGSFNKAFLLTFDNNVNVVAKIPCPLVAPRRLCTASEVATMDYARNILGIPVPRVLSWNADADASEVGTEYILMEHVQGTELWKRLYDDDDFDATCFVDQLVDVECRFTRHRFSQIGSLYYKEDVSPELQRRPLYAGGTDGDGSDRFRIGPCVDQEYWRGSRSLLDGDRGPWPDASAYVKAIVDIEKQWLSRFAVPRKTGDPFRRSGSENDPDAHAHLLDDLLALLPGMLPADELCAPVFWHPDLHAPNILVPSKGPADVLALLDWQGASVRPAFIQPIFAECMRRCDDDSVVRVRYEARARGRNPLCVAVRTCPRAQRVVCAVLNASRTWHEGTYGLRRVLQRFEESWEGSTAPGRVFLARWDADEVARHRKAYASWKKYKAHTTEVADDLQLKFDGWVTNGRYEDAKKRNECARRKWRAKKFGGPYPFQDGGRSWFLS